MKGEGSWVEGSEKRRGGLRRKGKRGANDRRARGKWGWKESRGGRGSRGLFTIYSPYPLPPLLTLL